MPFATKFPWRIEAWLLQSAAIRGRQARENIALKRDRFYLKRPRLSLAGAGLTLASFAALGQTATPAHPTATSVRQEAAPGHHTGPPDWPAAPPGHRPFAQDVLPSAARPAAKRVFMARQAALCLAATTEAEQRHHLPHGLLAAISRVETGRPMPVTGERQPWPWSVNADGETLFFDTRAEAVAETQSRLHLARTGHGPHFVDIGCMQVDISIHRNAFATLADAFNPAANAEYAATLMTQLHHRKGDWTAASQNYHSATPSLGIPYGASVRHTHATQRDTLASAAGRQ